MICVNENKQKGQKKSCHSWTKVIWYQDIELDMTYFFFQRFVHNLLLLNTDRV
jgi:hypothetical protein